jgi:hypothetical protein
MTLYLWYSPIQEEHALKRPEHPRFGGASNAPQRVGSVVYLDDMGEPVKATQVTHSPQHNTALPDIRLVGIVEKDILISCDRGILTEEGEQFCAKKGIAPKHDALMQYIGKHEQARTYLRCNLPVNKPLRLMRGGKAMP